jgi:hypothetical protein
VSKVLEFLFDEVEFRLARRALRRADKRRAKAKSLATKINEAGNQIGVEVQTNAQHEKIYVSGIQPSQISNG